METAYQPSAWDSSWGVAKCSIAPPIESEPLSQETKVPTLFTTFTIAAFALVPPAVIAAATSGEARSWTFVGAAVATVIAAISARKSEKEMGHTSSVICSSFFLGGIMPPAAVHYYSPETYQALIIDGWLLLGFFSGLSGWALTVAFMAAIPGFIQKNAQKYLGSEDQEKEKDEK